MSNLQIPINTALYTKDGRLVGNAFVIRHEKNKYIIRTDYGAYAHMTEEKILDLFYLEKGYSQEEMTERAKNHKFYVSPLQQAVVEEKAVEEVVSERIKPWDLRPMQEEEPKKSKRPRISAKPVKMN